MNHNPNRLYSFLITIKPYMCGFLLTLGLALLTCGFADNDLLSGTTADASATLFGSGEFYIYLAEFVVAIIGYITTRNLKVFIGIIVVAFILTSIAPHFLTQSTY